MESLRGIFPRTEPPPKRDFLKENVMRIKNMQRKKDTEYSNKFSKPTKTRKLSLYDDRAPTKNRSINSLTLCSKKAPIGNLRKSFSTLSIATQTVDPETDEYFLKDTIIRYPSASTIRSMGNSQHQLSHTCSKGHLLEQEEVTRPARFKSNFHDRRDDHSERMDRHVSNLSEYLDKGSLGKKISSILKSTSSQQKSNKDSLNEFQQKEDRHRVGSANRPKRDMVVINDDDNEIEIIDDSSKESESSNSKKDVGASDMTDAKKQQLKAASEDPDCPEGHVPLSENERLDSLKIAKKRFKELVDDLNRLPMTCETLRVRNRKIEIEKELRSLEINIRVFSRSKVYVKLTE